MKTTLTQSDFIIETQKKEIERLKEENQRLRHNKADFIRDMEIENIELKKEIAQLYRSNKYLSDQLRDREKAIDYLSR